MNLDFQLEPDDYNFDRQSGRVDLIVEPPLDSYVGISFSDRAYPEVKITFTRPYFAWWDLVIYAVKLCVVR